MMEHPVVVVVKPAYLQKKHPKLYVDLGGK
jgi:hypothetical protein